MRNKKLSSMQLEAVVEAMAEGLFVLDSNSSIVLWNKKMEELTGRSSKEVLGKSCSEIGRLCGTPENKQHCVLLLSGNVDGRECTLKNRQGDVIPVLRNSRILYDKNGVRSGAVATVADLRPLRKVQVELELARAQRENQPSVTNPKKSIVGDSQPMRQLNSLLNKAATTDVTVLIEGETGTGKELVARAIHKRSARRDKPFISVNCSALSAGLLESELFGHVRGAFTGAVENRIGRFEAAAGGTIFLDEVGELELSMQVKLLRVLQEKTIERLGETRSRKVDVRVLAATNRKLHELVRDGLFREDLYYRLKVFPLYAAPLRERKVDIPQLVDCFIRKFSKAKRGKQKITNEAMKVLMSHCWPGNVRELENAIHHSLILAGSSTIELEHLPTEVRSLCMRQSSNRVSVSRMTADELNSLLLDSRGNLSEVARILGVHRSTILRRVRKLGLQYKD